MNNIIKNIENRVLISQNKINILPSLKNKKNLLTKRLNKKVLITKYSFSPNSNLNMDNLYEKGKQYKYICKIINIRFRKINSYIEVQRRGYSNTDFVIEKLPLFSPSLIGVQQTTID
jgi:hypothetical protein